MTSTPFLQAWFEIMDSDRPERVLDRITDDFVMSIQFSTGEGQSAEFVGDRAGLVGLPRAAREERPGPRDHPRRPGG